MLTTMLDLGQAFSRFTLGYYMLWIVILGYQKI